MKNRMNNYYVTVEFEMAGGHKLRRKILESAINPQSAGNKIKARYKNIKKYGKSTIISIIARSY